MIRTCMTRVARQVLRRNPTAGRRIWVRNHFRKWCVDREMPVSTRYGFRMLASPRDYASYGIYFFGEYDPRMSEVIERFLKPGETAWDIGTDRGWFTLLMARRVGAAGRVDSFEAFPANVKRLEANIALNGMHWVHVHAGAVSDATGTLRFEPPSSAATDDLAFLEHCSGAGFVTAEPSQASIAVPAVRLDDVAAELNLQSLSLIKMDIEGAEVRALDGGRQTIARLRPILAIEYNRATLVRAGTSMQELDDRLAAMDYVRLAYRGGGFAPVNLDECRDKSDAEAVFNVYAFHGDDPRRPA